MTSKENEFVVAPCNYCFLCLNQIKIPSKHKQEELPSAAIYSIQHLSKYLKLDMRKIFQGPVPQHLLEKVERSKLKVELCSECSRLNRKLSRLFEQLERIEMEIAFRLCTVSDKIRDSEESRKMELIKNQFEIHNETLNVDDLLGKLEIVGMLREEVNSKCSNKLHASGSIPKVPIEQIKWKKSIAEAKVSLGNGSSSETLCNVSKPDQFKMENTSYPIVEATDTDDDNFINFGAAEDEYDNHPSPSSHSSSQSDEASNRSNMKGRTVKRKLKSESNSSLVINKNGRDKKFSVIDKKNRNLPVVPSPIKSGPGGTVNKGDISSKRVVNPVNGHHKCQICCKEFMRYESFFRHFKSVHMKVSYTCPVPDCGKSFGQKVQYEIHYQSLHLGIHYRCQSCLRTFVQKFNLVRHVKMVHPEVPCVNDSACQ